MKYIVVLGDGMADYPVPELDNKTPLTVAKKPNIDMLASQGEIGLSTTLYADMPTGSDVATLSVLGYDPRKYYTGRSPIEALGLNLPIDKDDTIFRCNFVTLSDEEAFEDKRMLDYSAGKITNEEAHELISAINAELGTDIIKFFNGVSYRHIMTWRGIEYDYTMIPPHDITDKAIGDHLPKGKYAETVLGMMKKSVEILSNHSVNKKRIEKGLYPANCIWLWGEGKKPEFITFKEKYGVGGSVITAVPLINGLAAGLELNSIEVEGATGLFDTNYSGKAQAALEAIDRGDDFVFVHIEAPDECGHDGEIEHKVKSIENIDELIVKAIKEGMDKRNIPYRMLIMPDHATPLNLRTHTTDPVPYIIYDSTDIKNNPVSYNEDTAASSGKKFDHGYNLMPYFLQNNTNSI